MVKRSLLVSLALAAAPLAAQTAAPPPASVPVEHRLSPDEIAAAQAEGAERNRAAEALAMSRGDPALALPLERKQPVHGAFEVGIGSNGAREVAGEVTTGIGDSGSATVAGSYTQFGRQRLRPF